MDRNHDMKPVTHLDPVQSESIRSVMESCQGEGTRAYLWRRGSRTCRKCHLKVCTLQEMPRTREGVSLSRQPVQVVIVQAPRQAAAGGTTDLN